MVPPLRSSAIVSAALGVALLGCGDDPPRDPPGTATSPLASDGAHLYTADGRLALLRGVNARVDGVFDVTFADGRIALEELPMLTPADCRRMRGLGFDLLRLPINWSGVEPVRGQIDAGYLDRVAAAVTCAADAGLLVVIDLHQDAYSKEIGEDGAPLWAIVPAPDMLLQGPLTDLEARRTSAQVMSAMRHFFAAGDPDGLQAACITALEAVARRFADHPAVVGFELWNEPIAATALVDGFSQRAAAAVRAAAPAKLVFFEPSAYRNFLDMIPPSPTPFPVEGAVYAPHVYTFVFGADPTSLENLVPADLEPSVAAARAEADAWGTPLWIGEYGVGPDQPNADLWMGVQAELHDRFFASDAFWLWKEQSQGAWGVYRWDGAQWIERPQVVAWISRVHAARIGGRPVANVYDHVTGSLQLTVERATLPHAIYVPEAAAATFTARCDGAAVTAPRDPATGLVELACDGTLIVTP